MIRVAICDDEKMHVDILHGYIAHALDSIQEEYQIINFYSATELMLYPEEYEILFLDLRLEDGKDGINIGMILREKGYEQIIIIVTSMSHRTRDGYFTKALRFIQKPIQLEEITEALQAAISELKNSSDRIAIRFKGATSFIPINSIIAVETYYGKRMVYTGQKDYETNERWEELLARLPKYRFFCVNRSYCINMSQVQSIEKTQVIMTGGKAIKFGRGKKKELDHAFHAYIGGLKNDRIYAPL